MVIIREGITIYPKWIKKVVLFLPSDLGFILRIQVIIDYLKILKSIIKSLIRNALKASERGNFNGSKIKIYWLKK